ncbi:4'-phosphopantetheinyl transferase family protein [Alcaligenes sp. RM2]|uniref:4'-phosphopantetheinyl transferase family protein n=1 Tax=Alcaligenes TaxID=507 RepID=UPI00202FFAC8|nr:MULTISPECIES: 4'-phosphopantetheinyl transferase superfamily protein [Alcaligenes]URW83182.1 4'-phosphopantetheinyl transferase superfamily protein [Alcaligenes sp. DN25]WEA68012.1 4'-phosphopantetheinyl transferase superfamily protein [Alcaligenes faecalis]
MLSVYSLSLPLPDGMESWLRNQVPDHTLAVIARRRQQSDQHLSLLAHGALRHFLAPLLGCTPRAVPITQLEHGKPVLDLDDADLHFSLSHSGERVLIGIADRTIGIDIEAMRLPVKAGLVEHCSVPSERSWLKSDLDFYALWCGKEAALKHAGTGFHIQPQELSLDGHPDHGCTVQSPHPILQGLVVHSHRPVENYAAAICLNTPFAPWTVSFLDSAQLPDTKLTEHE